MPGIGLEFCLEFWETKRFCVDGETNGLMQSINDPVKLGRYDEPWRGPVPPFSRSGKRTGNSQDNESCRRESSLIITTKHVLKKDAVSNRNVHVSTNFGQYNEPSTSVKLYET